MPFFNSNVIVSPAKAKVVEKEKEEDDIAALIWQENQFRKRETEAAAAVSKKKVDAVGAICSATVNDATLTVMKEKKNDCQEKARTTKRGRCYAERSCSKAKAKGQAMQQRRMHKHSRQWRSVHEAWGKEETVQQ